MSNGNHGPVPKETYDILERRYNSLVRATSRQDVQIGELREMVRKRDLENQRMAAELAAEKRNVQLLGDDHNKYKQSMGKEVAKLREKVKALGGVLER